MMSKVFLGIPTYDDRINMGMVNGMYGASQHGAIGTLQFVSNSWLTRNFNRLFAQALNERTTKGITHFCLWHEDIEIATPHWLDRMLGIMDKESADVLSVVVPLKSPEGLTSTAMDEPVRDQDPHYRVRRLTMTEAFDNYPNTFTNDRLLVNTGVMLINLAKPWVDNIWFEFEDKIVRDEKTGKFDSVGVPEDWNFSRRAKRAGASIWATREITVIHHGRLPYGNEKPWGFLKKDR